MVSKPLHIPGRRFVLTKRRILEAQKSTKSAMAAARWLSVSYNTYKKWAKYYNIFDQHKNQSGVGIKKGWATYKVPLDDIMSGKRKPPQRYSGKVLKKRLVEDGYFHNECSNCGYNEVNLATGKVCLNIDFKDGDRKEESDNILIINFDFCYLKLSGASEVTLSH